VILDAYALVASLRGETATETVRGLLLDEDLFCRTISTAAAETVDRVSRLGGHPPEQVALSLLELGLEITPVDDDLAVRAGVLRAEAYHRTRSPLSLGDCLVAAEALRCRDVLVTADPALLDLVASRGGSVIALPASDGSVHEPDVRPPAHLSPA
jgi:PIN domain nuclease of toxin-antitoxin system